MNALKKQLYQLLKKNETVFDFIQEEAVNGLWFWSLENLDKKWVNPAFCEALGYDINCVDNKVLLEIIYPQDRKILEDIYTSLTTTEKNNNSEKTIRFYHKDGSIIWFSFSFLEVKDENQQPTYLLIGHKEVTQKNVNSLVSRYESILNNHSIFIVRTDLEGNYSYVNNYFCERFNFDRGDIMDKTSMTAIVGEDHQKCIEAVQKCFENPYKSVFVQLRKPIFDKDKKQFTEDFIYTEWEYSAILDNQKNITEIQCVGIEVTDKIVAEQGREEKAKQLAHTQRLLQSCNENTKVGIWELDIKTNFTKWDKIIKEIHEVDDDFVADVEIGVSFYTKEDKERITKHVALAIQEGKSYDDQFQIITYKGNKKWVRSIGKPIMENGKCVELYGTFQDITIQKETELTLEEKIEELETTYHKLTHTQKLLDASNKTAQIGTWLFNLDEGVVVGNKITQQIHEMNDDFVVTPEKGILFYKEGYSREIITRAFTKAVEEGVSYDEQLKIVTVKGNEIWIRTIGIPVFENGKCVEVYGTFHNIDKQKSNEISLQQKLEELEISQNQLLRTSKLLETCNASASIGTWEYDTNTRDIEWDKIIQSIYELPEGVELDTPAKISFFKKGENRERAIQVVKEAREEGKPFDEKLEIINFRGKHKWVRIIGIPQLKDGRCIELYGTLQDITPQKQDELNLKQKVNELEQSQQEIQDIQTKLSTTLEKTGIGLWEYDLVTHKGYWDKQIRKMFGVTEFEEMNNEIASAKIPEETRVVMNQMFEDLIMQKIPTHHMKYCVNLTKDSIKYYDSKVVLIKDENNQPISVFGVTQDITPQTEAELQIQEKVRELEKAKQEIQKNQERYEFTLDNTGIGLWELDINNQEVYWDKQAQKIFGVNVTNPIARTVAGTVIHQEDIDEIDDNIEMMIQGKLESYEKSYRTVPIEGKTRFLHTRAILMRDENQNPMRIFGIIQDVTKQKEYEQIIEEQNKDLAASEQELRKGIREMFHMQQDLAYQKQQIEQIFDAVPAMIYQFRRDSEGNVSFPLVSKGSKFILGIDPKTILNNKSTEIFEAIHPEDLLGFKSSVKQSTETMQKWESELRLLKDGKETWVHATSKPTHMDDGGITWTGIMQNIDNLKETEFKVQEQNKELQKTLNQLRETQSQLIHNEKMTTLGQLVASIAHEINTPLGAIRSSAGTIFKMLKSTFSDLPKTLKLLSEKQLDDFNKIIEKAAEINNIYSSREKRSMKYKLIAEFDDRDIHQADRIADILVDTGLNEYQELYEPFLELPQAMDIFHSIYKISTIMKSNATVRIATEKASKIIITLKNFSRQDHTGEKKPTNINKSLENTLILYQNKLKYGIEVVRKMEDLPLINAYEDELAQVWTNLLHNAIQAIDKSTTRKGKIYLTTQKQENKILISVRDTGAGIPDEVQQKIFDAFFTTKPAGEGTGLGLNIVRKIIEKHDGKIWFETENIGENTGTTFFVELPIQ